MGIRGGLEVLMWSCHCCRLSSGSPQAEETPEVPVHRWAQRDYTLQGPSMATPSLSGDHRLVVKGGTWCVGVPGQESM